MTAQTTHFFAGANSGEGFRNLFGHIANPDDMFDFMILKGGPGVGKNTFMREIGQTMEQAGADVEYLWCSGDPDSLDGVILPQIRCAIADGTSPHVLEPRYPAGVDRYVNLGRFYDILAAKYDADAIKTHTREYQAAYVRAYSALKAARQIELDAVGSIRFDLTRAKERFVPIARRELRPKQDDTRPAHDDTTPYHNGITPAHNDTTPYHNNTTLSHNDTNPPYDENRRSRGKYQAARSGKTTRRFLGSLTHRGYVWRFDSVETLCPKIYALADRFGFAGPILSALHETAIRGGWDTIVCMAPEDPERIEHLLIPERGVAFITTRPGMEYEPKHVQTLRRVRLDALAQPSDKALLRLETRMVGLLRDHAVEELRQAKACHDALEGVYNPYVDFDGVRALAAQEAGRLLNIWERYSG